jgi:CHAT domain-containing protein
MQKKQFMPVIINFLEICYKMKRSAHGVVLFCSVIIAAVMLNGCSSVAGLVLNSDADDLYHSGRYKELINRYNSEYPSAIKRGWIEDAKRRIIAGGQPSSDIIRYYFVTRELVVALIETGNFEKARLEIDEALNNIKKLDELHHRYSPPLKTDLSLSRETTYRLVLYKAYLGWLASGDEKRAFRYVDSLELEQLDLIPKIWFSLERAFFQEKILGDYAAALISLRKVLTLTQQLDWTNLDSKFAYSMQAYQRMAWIQMKLGRLADARNTLEEYQSMSQDVFLKTGKSLLGSTEYFRGYLSIMDSTAGAVFAASRDFKEAERFFDSARTSLESIPPESDHMWDRNALAAYHVLYGAYYQGLSKNYREAAQSVEKGLTYLRPAYIDAVQNEIDIESAYLLAAELNLMAGNPLIARNQAQQSIKFASRYWNAPVSTSAHVLLGIIAFEENNTKAARTELELAAKLSKKVNADNWKLYYWLGKVDEKIGQTNAALRYYLRSVDEVEKLWDGRFNDVVRQLSFIDERLIVYEPTILGLIRANRPADAIGIVEKAKARTFYESPHSISNRAGDRSLRPEGTPLSYHQIKEMLPTDTALLEYYIGNESVVVFSLNGTGDLIGKKLGISPDQLKNKVFNFYDHISDMDEGFSDSKEYERLSVELYDTLVRPVEKNISKQMNLGIIPHGFLHYLPFHALIVKNENKTFGQESMESSEPDYLIKRHAIFYGPSSTILNFSRSVPRRDRDSFLAIGSPPVVDISDLGLQIKKLEKPILTEETILTVSKLFTQPAVFVDQEATETTAKQYMANFDNILIAAHGEFIPNNSIKSAIFLEPDRNNDGRLTIKEIEQLNLRANLVVLSACKTAMVSKYSLSISNEPKEQDLPLGDDLVSLQRVFLRDGAASVVSTMWSAYSPIAKEIVSDFFERYKAGDSKLDALRNAQLRLIEHKDRYHNPFFWAPFILSGDWEH